MSNPLDPLEDPNSPKVPDGIDLFVIGKKDDPVKRGLVHWLINLLIIFLRKIIKVDENKTWDLIDEIARRLNIENINDVVKGNPLLLERRIKREVSNAIKDYHDMMDGTEPPVVPVFTEEKEGETPLGGELRLSSNLNGQKKGDQKTD